jgi:RNA polymerase sigma-54 factor
MGQHMVLLPRMLQSIEVLQLPGQELSAWLREAAEGNEALQVEERPPEVRDSDRAAFPRSRGTREDSQRHDEFLSNQPAPERGLVEQVEEQLALLDLDPAHREWARFLVQCLDPSGYLSAGDEFLMREAVARGLPGEASCSQRALKILSTLEPPGIGARNAIEALLMQIDPGDPDYELLGSLLHSYLSDVAKNKLPVVARAMGLTLADVQRLIERLRVLDFRPAARLDAEVAPALHPDVLVQPNGNDFEVLVDGSSQPVVSIAPDVLSFAKDRSQTKEVKSYLRDKIDRARWIIEAVEQRRETLGRIAGRLFEHQLGFLEHGAGHLVPLRMTDLADELGIHVSTVSRAVAGKYAQTPWGILPLRHFFQGAAGADSGSARDDVRDAVGEIFAGEDKTRPLSDDDVVALMDRKGWKLARRTVAKYRQELGIPSSYRRRRYD